MTSTASSNTMHSHFYLTLQKTKFGTLRALGIKKLAVLTFAAATIFLLCQNGVLAQDVEEVVVTAEQSDFDSLDDLASVSLIDGEKLADAGIENVEDVAAYVPNLTLTETETGTSICVRGICAGVNQGFDQSVGLFSDRVPLPRANMARSPFLDLAGVQVYRGPQYILDGNFSIAGSVHMITDLKTDEFNASVDFNYIPSQNDRKLELAFGGPISDSFSAKLVTQYKQSDGYVENVFLGRDEPTSDELVSRLVFGFRPSEDLFFKLKAEVGDFNRKGRSSEIILDQPTPNVDKTVNIGGNNIRRPPSEATVTRLPFVEEFEFALAPLGTFYSESASFSYIHDALYDPADPGLEAISLGFYETGLQAFRDSTYAFNNRSFLEKLAEVYVIGTSTEAALAPVTYISGSSTFDRANTRSTIRALEQSIDDALSSPELLLPGALDDQLDFKRSVDTNEFSNNDSLNLTLNVDYSLGDSQIELTTSYIEYEVEELIDGDVTPYNIIQTSQLEDYSQAYHRLDFTSPADQFLEVKAGVAYMEAELTFSDLILIGIDDNQQSFIDHRDAGSELANNGRYRPGFDARNYFGSFEQGEIFVTAISGLSPQRDFEQEQTLQTAYLDTTQNWTDTFRTRLGFRYTRSKKKAIRDLALVTGSTRGNFYDPTDRLLADPDFNFTSLLTVYAAFLGIQLHTDNMDLPGLIASEDLDDSGVAVPAIRGVRTDEDLLPTIKAEWDVNQSLSVFATYSQANKVGGFDARSNSTPNVQFGTGVPLGTFEFEDEVAETFELGGTLFWDTGQLTAVGFYTEYEDLQLSRFDGRSGFNVDNAGAASNQGVEIEGFWQPFDQFTINYSAAYIDFVLDDFGLGSCHLDRRPDNYVLAFETNAPEEFNFVPGGFIPILYPNLNDPDSGPYTGDYGVTAGVGSTSAFGFIQSTTGDSVEQVLAQSYTSSFFANAAFCDFSGQTTQFVPEYAATFSFSYETELASVGIINPVLDVIYNSGYETSVSQDPLVAQSEYVQFNARLALSAPEEVWEVALVGENLTNEKIVSYANDTVGARIQGARGFIGFVRPPRSIGLNFRYQLF